MIKLLFSPEGRIDRKGFWIGFSISVVTSVLLKGFLVMNGAFISTSESAMLQLLSIIPIYILFVVSIKRYHDLGKSGWWSVIVLVPVVGMLFIIIECGFGSGRRLKNEWGKPVTGPLAK